MLLLTYEPPAWLLPYLVDSRLWQPPLQPPAVDATKSKPAPLQHASSLLVNKEWEQLKRYYGNCCLACGVSETDEPLTRDHIVPRIKGGLNLIHNIQPLCRPCNSRKGSSVIDYRHHYQAQLVNLAAPERSHQSNNSAQPAEVPSSSSHPPAPELGVDEAADLPKRGSCYGQYQPE